MTKPSEHLEKIKRVTKMGRDLVDPARSADFEASLEAFVVESSVMLGEISEPIAEADKTALREFGVVHAEVIRLTAGASKGLTERLAALERNRPALIKYLLQR